MLDGYKTYIAAAGFVLLAAYHAIEGDFEEASKYFAMALGFLGVRHAIAKKA